jgi:hypothetical protein
VERLRRYVLPVVLGALGMLGAYAGLHVWQDHRTFHALIDFITAQQAAAAKQQRPEAPK